MGKRVHPWLSCKAMGGGTQPFVAQPFSAASGAVGEESGELSGFSSSGVCSTDLR